MTESSRIRKTIKASRAVKVWFWDTVREYVGDAVSLTPEKLIGLIKIGGYSSATTVLPARLVMEGLIRHLTDRVVEFKINGQAMEVNLKGTIKEVSPDFENPRRILLVAELRPTSERNQEILKRLGQGLVPS